MKKRYWLAILCAILALALTVAAASADTGDDYKKMTDASGLHDGDKVIFVSDDGNNYQAMATDFSGVQVTVTDNLITEQDGMLPLTLSETDGGWFFAADGGYLAVIEGALTVVPDQEDAATWSVSIASNGVATISCATGNLIFAEQDGAYRFFCGESGNEIAIFNSTFEAEQHAFGDGLWWSFAKGKLTIGGNGDMRGFSSSDQPWSSIRSEITALEIQNGVTSIGDSAFYRYTGLTSVTIGSGVTSIGCEVFYGCTGLTEITIPDGVTRIGTSVLYGCTGLTSITLGNGVTSIGSCAFTYTGWWNAQSDGLVYLNDVLLAVKGSCGQIVRIEDGTRMIADNVFKGYKSITKVTIPDSVAYIGEWAFEECEGLTEITIPDGVTSISGYAFSSCTGLTSITIPDSVTYIGEWAFSHCTGLTSITIGSGVASVGSYAFYGCTGLNEIMFPDGVTSISLDAFAYCTGLESITIPDSVTSIGYGAFSGCTGLNEITIPDGVTSIGEYAFSDCTGLTSLTMPCSAGIGNYAFQGCTSITNVVLTEGTGTMVDYMANNYFEYRNTPWYISRNNTLTITLEEGIQNISYQAFREITGEVSITIPNSVTSIADHAFYSCTGLRSITIPDSVTSIEGFTFYECTGLESVTIGSGVTSIGNSAFRGCTALTEITIPDSVTSLDYSVFYNCTGLQSVTIPCVENLRSSAFYGCTAITDVHLTEGTGIIPDNWPLFNDIKSNTLTVTMDEGIESIGKYAFSRCTGLQLIKLPNSMTSIGEYAFSDCTELESISFGNGSISLDCYAFCNCTALTSIAFQGNTNLGDRAFCNCTGLSSIAFQGDTNIGSYAFYGCTELESISFGNGAITIDNYAFNGCTGLSEIIISDGVTRIGEYAFYNCTGLKSVTLPNSKMNVDGFAFYGCSALTDVYYIGTPTDRDNNLTVDEYGNAPLLNATWHYELAFTTQPKSVTVANGKTATFKVVAKGGTVSYQWYYSKDNGTKWTKMSGKTSASLSVKASTTTNGYLYRCVAKNAKYTETSKNAKLTVSGVKPKIVVQPKAATVASGKSNTFKVVAAGSGLKYQWYYSKDNGTKWTKMSGKTSASLKIKGSATTNGYLYRCKITNTKGSVTSKSVKLTVSGVKPRILTQPKAASVKSGKTAKFTVAAAGVDLTYQWYYSKNAGKTWTKMSGKTAATLSVKGSKTNNGYLYRCVVKNTKGSVTSKNAKLTVK